ncbi:TPA: hypothetical protein QDB48_000975 [Burkholderia vietnamiensis]|nr:hypothetical protein [Burkholderia vietnamiensis]
MTRCSHDVPLEHPCKHCTAEGLASLPKIAGEHGLDRGEGQIRHDG